MKVGSFVKWSGTDDGRRFAYVGKLIDQTDERVTMLTVDGEMSFPLEDGKVEKAKKPTAFDDLIKRREVAVAKRAKKSSPKRKRTRAKRSGKTKLARSRELLITNGVWMDFSRKEGIALLVDMLSMTPAGASTYFATIKKEAA